MTKNELKSKLTAANVAFAPKANLETLQGLWDSYLAAYNPYTGEEQVLDSNCPHCGIGLDNGLLHVDDETMQPIPDTNMSMSSGKTYREVRDMDFAAGEYKCMGCGGHFGVIPEFPATPGTGLKIEKDRPEQNGIKRPSAGGRCRAVWDALDAYLQETGDQPTAKDVKEIAADEGWNPNNASIEFYQWRKFHGIKGRQPKAPVEAPAA